MRDMGTVECWGSNFGFDLTAPEGRFRFVAAGSSHSCGIRLDDTVECWGRSGAALETPPAGHFTDIAIGADHACAVRITGTIECWSHIRPPPPEVTFHSAARRLSAGVSHARRPV